ncbi:hypothetical protein RIF29_11669 [Crotalaria pallida]|uniref:Uncharacterized protein n=1 Tax=Crotalaria pallida TaxID=3830 RepID=A0AAN9P077_CROPI
MTTAQPSTEAELPECPVCIETYNDTVSIPRVLSCGHSICEACLISLPQRYPNTIRCPACTQLANYSSQQGPSSLPKNIDLLRISLQHSPPSSKSNLDRKKQNQPSTIDGRDRFWSDEFYASWKGWILPHDAVSVETGGFVRFGSLNYYSRVCFGGNDNNNRKSSNSNRNSVSLVRVASLPPIVNDSKFRFGYVARIMKGLEGMREVEREGLILVLEASERRLRRMCRVYGLWSEIMEEVDDGELYLVCERHRGGSLLDKFSDLRNGFLGAEDKGGVFSFAMIGMGICESVLALHSEGLVAGCLGLSCFSFDELGGVCIDFNEALAIGRKVWSTVMDTVSGATSGKQKEEDEASCTDCLKSSKPFISLEVLFRLLRKGDITHESGHSSYPIGHGADVWSLACVLLLLLIGDAVPQYTFEMNEENGFDHSDDYVCWVDKVKLVLEEKLGPEYLTLRQTLCKCLDINPGNRPDVADVRKCIRDMLVKPQFDFLGNLESAINRNSTDHCLVLGELFQPKGSSKDQRECELQEKEDGGQPDFVEDGEDKSDEDFRAGLSKGMAELKDLRGHLDCISGLAVGGGYLLSSSFDKTVRVWSLQDFSHLHTFRGHENKVMALVCVDEEEPLCISGDSGGGIFVWKITTPFRQEDPLRKWCEQKDWRFSGIHSLTAYRNNCLYSGSGDRTIKAWSLEDGSLICSMNGHSSVVSTLAICDEVLYSGSWDGTVRLWSLNDHSPLTVLGEDVTIEMKSVLAITVDRHLLVAACENGCIKVWRNDVFMNSKILHNGAIFAMNMQGKCLYTGGWDKNVNIQELSGDEFELDVKAFGSIPCSSVVTALLCCQGKLFVGYADKSIKVTGCSVNLSLSQTHN